MTTAPEPHPLIAEVLRVLPYDDPQLAGQATLAVLRWAGDRKNWHTFRSYTGLAGQVEASLTPPEPDRPTDQDSAR